MEKPPMGRIYKSQEYLATLGTIEYRIIVW